MTSPSVLATEAAAHPGCGYTKDNNVLYQYTPIDNTEGAIRLLILRGGTGRVIDCDLIDSTIDNRGRPYEAVSYTWGPEFASDLINIRGKDLPVTFNLGLILRDLRSPDVDRVIWVDAVCINQQDATEKGHQVAQMKDIFRSAKCVLFCICRPTEHTDFLMDSLKRLEVSLQDTKSVKRHNGSDSWHEIQTLIARQHLNPHQPQFEASLQRQVKALALLHRQGLEYILNQPWFLRVWILQEVANASNAFVYCGRKFVSAATFALSSELLNAEFPCGLDGVVAQVISLMPGSLRTNVSQDLYPLLQRFRGSLATVERDSIYALFGICRDVHINTHVQPNYTKPDKDVIIDTISYICHVETSAIANSFFSSVSDFQGELDHLDTKLLAHVLEAGDHRSALSLFRHRGDFITVTSEILIFASTDKMMKEGVMTLLLEHHDADILFSDWTGWDSTCIAAEFGYESIAKSMLEKVTDIESKRETQNGATRLLLAAENGNTNLFRLLLEIGADVNCRDRHKKTATHHAVSGGHDAIVSLLLEKGASPWSKEGFYPPIWLAVRHCRPSTLSLLLEAGADASQRGLSHLFEHILESWFIPWSKEYVLKETHNLELVVRILLEKGARSYTALAWASMLGNTAIVQSLIEYGFGEATINQRCSKPFYLHGDGAKYIYGTPLTFATLHGNKDVVQILLENGADPEIRANMDRTPLSWAASEGQRDIVELLLDAGADIQAEDEERQTPLALAESQGHESIIALLVERGAEIMSGTA